MHFDFIDTIAERSEDRIVTLKSVTSAEEYLRDHFPSFPVLPGVFMLESMVQAARALLEGRDEACGRHVLGEVRALKYGTFVKPGDTMRVEVSLHKDAGEGAYAMKGEARVASRGGEPMESPPACVSGRFVMRPIRAGLSA